MKELIKQKMKERIKSVIFGTIEPTFHRLFLTTISLSIYYNTYYNHKIVIQPLLGALFFPAFYIAYMYIFYPENFNYKNENPTIPKTGFSDEFNVLKDSPIKTLYLFIVMYLYFTYFLYEKKFRKLYSKLT